MVWCFVCDALCSVLCFVILSLPMFYSVIMCFYDTVPVILVHFCGLCVVTGVIVHFCGSVFLGCDSFCFVIRVFDFVILYFCFRVLILWFSVCDLLVLLFSALWFCVIRIFVIFLPCVFRISGLWYFVIFDCVDVLYCCCVIYYNSWFCDSVIFVFVVVIVIFWLCGFCDYVLLFVFL